MLKGNCKYFFRCGLLSWCRDIFHLWNWLQQLSIPQRWMHTSDDKLFWAKFINHFQKRFYFKSIKLTLYRYSDIINVDSWKCSRTNAVFRSQKDKRILCDCKVKLKMGRFQFLHCSRFANRFIFFGNIWLKIDSKMEIC